MTMPEFPAATPTCVGRGATNDCPTYPTFRIDGVEPPVFACGRHVAVVMEHVTAVGVPTSVVRLERPFFEHFDRQAVA